MPLGVLRDIIRHRGESISDFLQKEVNPRVASIREEAQERLDKLLRREGELGTTDAPSPAAHPSSSTPNPAKMLEASQRALEEWQRKVDERVKAAVDNLSGNLPAMGRDLQALLQKLEALEKKVDALEAAKKSRDPQH